MSRKTDFIISLEATTGRSLTHSRCKTSSRLSDGEKVNAALRSSADDAQEIPRT